MTRPQTPMESRPGVGSVRASVLRSVNGVTGALIGVAAAATYVLAAVATEMAIGRPGPNQLAGAIVFGLPFLCGLGALVGALLGSVGGIVVRRTTRARASERHVLAGTLVLVVLVAGFSGLLAARRSEAGQQPRVMRSTSAVARLGGFGMLTPDTPAIPVFDLLPTGDGRVLSWGGAALGVKLDGETLMISRDSAVIGQVNLSGLDYVRQVYGVTSTDEQGREWLAMLVRLRATGRRELLLIYDPAGELVHEELLARTKSGPAPVLWNGGRSAGEQGFLLDVGEPLRYVIKK
jgi:hypothetical protein